MNLTASQHAAVWGRGGNLLVSASAGSGKTEVLARRCLSLIADGRCEVERLLVVTFTRAAAAELRVRIAGMLHALVPGPQPPSAAAPSPLAPSTAGPDMDRALCDHLRRQAVLIDAADVCTIDSWCSRLVRENFVEAGVDPAFAALDQEQARLLRHEVLDAVFDDVYAGRGELAADVGGWIGRGTQAGDKFLRDMVLALSEYLDHLVWPETWLERNLAAALEDEPAQRLRATAMLAAALAEECEFQREALDALAGTAGALGVYRTALDDWARRLRGSPEQLDAVGSEIGGFKFPRRPRGDAAPALLEEVKESWHAKRLKKRWNVDDVRAMVENAGRCAELTATLLRLTRLYRDRLAGEKARRGSYEFADVQRMALDLLGGPQPPPAASRRPVCRLRQPGAAAVHE